MPEETKIFYYIGDEKTPYVSKINVSPNAITLGDFKAAVKKPNYKFFFRSNDQDFGVVKEEITNDESHLPLCENRIVAWLVAPDPDTVSQGSVTNSNSNQVQPERTSFQPTSDTKANDAETDSVISSHKGRPSRHQRHLMYNQYGSQSTLMSSDLCSTTSWDSKDDMSEYSTCTDMAASSRYRRTGKRNKKYSKTKHRHSPDTTSTYSSSITDSSMSLNILCVTLNMEKYQFLGISIVGQSNDKGDGGIYIGSIMKGGAVAADGRIEPGDMLLQVNDVNFENMSNEDAVRELRNIVHKPGPITLTVAKCWDPNPESSYFTIPKDEPVRPIDPAVWATHISAVQGTFQGGTPPYTTNHETSSDTLASSLPESERYDRPLSIHTDMAVVVKTMKMRDSGLDVKTRMWLKITIPDAFIGSDLVDWLNQKVEGLGERRDARKYASSLLKVGYIRHTVNKITFSEQCYYVFGDYTGLNIPKDMAALSLGDSNSDRDSDTLGPLPISTGGMPWSSVSPLPPGTSHPGYPTYHQHNPYHQSPHLSVGPRLDGVGSNGIANTGMDYPQPPAYSNTRGGNQSDADTLSLRSANRLALAHRANSQSSLSRKHLASFGGNGSGGSGSDQASESRFSYRSSHSGAGSSSEKPRSQSGSERSCKTVQSQQSMNKVGPYQGPLPPQPAQRPPSRSQNPRPLNAVPQEMSSSRQSFQKAMGNPCDYFVDVM